MRMGNTVLCVGFEGTEVAGEISNQAKSKPTCIRRENEGSVKRYPPRQTNHATNPESLPRLINLVLCPENRGAIQT